MGGSCDGDCNSCVPEDFCHQLAEDNFDTQQLITKLKGKLKGRESLLKGEQDLRVELATIMEEVRYSLITEINNYDEDSLLHTVIEAEQLLRMADQEEMDLTFDDGSAYKEGKQ